MPKWVLPLAVSAATLAVIEAAQRLGLLSVIVPAPSKVLLEVVLHPQMVVTSCAATLYTAGIGFFAALIITMLAASLAVSLRAFYNPVYNVGILLHSIPVIALAPLLALWIGTGPAMRVVIAALACEFAMLVGMMQGLRAADKTQRELMHVMAATPFDTLRFLLVPAALPYLFAGFKIGAPAAILGAITAEWAGADRGVGALMLSALFAFDTPKVWLSVLLTCVLAAASYGIWAAIEQRAVRWDRAVELAD
jgi:ABC-type nitrate/sulfonate/bicarbonate transport system permease component